MIQTGCRTNIGREPLISYRVSGCSGAISEMLDEDDVMDFPLGTVPDPAALFVRTAGGPV